MLLDASLIAFGANLEPLRYEDVPSKGAPKITMSASSYFLLAQMNWLVFNCIIFVQSLAGQNWPYECQSCNTLAEPEYLPPFFD